MRRAEIVDDLLGRCPIETKVTHAFRRSLLLSALFALLVLPVLAVELVRRLRLRPVTAEEAPPPSAEPAPRLG